MTDFAAWDRKIARWRKSREAWLAKWAEDKKRPIWPEKMPVKTAACPLCGRPAREQEHRYDAMDREPGDIPAL